MNKYSVGIIGCGNIFGKHADAIKKISNCRLVAVADINIERAIAVSKKYNCKWYSSYREMIKNEKLDVVHICLPHNLHAEVAIECLNNELDVIIEKPIALTVDDALAIRNTGIIKKRRVMVIYQNRFIKSTGVAKEIVLSQKYGKIIGVSADVKWNRNRKYYNSSTWRGKKKEAGGGVLITQAIHTLDLLEYLLGEIATVNGRCCNLNHDFIDEVEDVIQVSFNFVSGIKGMLFATTCNPYCIPASIEINFENAKLLLTNNRVMIEKNGKCEVVYESYGKDICYGGGHFLQLNSFYNKQCNAGSSISLEDAIRSIYVINSVYNSCKLEKTIDVVGVKYND